MGLQVSYCICAKVQEKGVFRRKTIRNKGNFTKVMSMERGRNN